MAECSLVFECFHFVLCFMAVVVVSDVGGHQTPEGQAIQLLSIGDPMISNVGYISLS